MELSELSDPADNGGSRSVRELEAVYDIPVTVSAVLGKTTMQVSQLLKLGRGAVERIFGLTYKPDYFKKFGFKRVKTSGLPHKIWAECINCCKFPKCQEVALLKEI